jgi:hypothetical protein
VSIWRLGARLLRRDAPPTRRRRPAAVLGHAWWSAADAAAVDVSAEAIERLRRAADAVTDPDEAERAEEMLDGLDRVLALAAAPLAALETQHRVIGSDTCHFSVPVSLRGEAESFGRLFVTSTRLVFAGPRVRAWAWHRVSRVVRQERTVTLVVAGGDAPALVCNSYGDAMVVAHLAGRLIK